MERARQEDVFLPESENPKYSLFPAAHSPDKLIGSMNPCHDGGLVGRPFLLISKEGEGMDGLLVGIEVSK